MKSGWFWPMYGDADEVVFTYSNSRGKLHIEQVLQDQFCGTLINDGYAAYARYAAAQETKNQHDSKNLKTSAKFML